MLQSATKICKVVALGLCLVAVTVSLSFSAPPPPPGSAPPPPPPGGEPFHVTGASLTATPSAYEGKCPVVITFTGTITTKGTLPPNTQGVVKYIFTRSDGVIDTNTKMVVFRGPATASVTDTWTLGDPTKLSTYTGWEAIKILSPVPMESGHADFKIACKAPEKAPQKPSPAPQ